jgi:hypothetical protein
VILSSNGFTPRVHAFDTPEDREAAYQRSLDEERRRDEEAEQKRKLERARQTEFERAEENRKAGRSKGEAGEREPAPRDEAPAPEPDTSAVQAAGAKAEADNANADPSAPPPPPAPPDEGDYAGGPARTHPEAVAPQDDYAEVEERGFKRRKQREFSVRFDPLNWLIQGRLSIEVEASLWEFLSVQVVPIVVTGASPIALNYASLDDKITQHSNGIGPISGISIGLGAWLSGEPFKGYVIRLELTNYGYEYRAADSMGTFDRVTFTERRLKAFFGSHSRFGPLTFAGGFGLGLELHQVERCGLTYVSGGGSSMDQIEGRSSDCHGKQLIALDREPRDTSNLNGPLHPVYIEARFSLGVVF